MTTLAYVRRSSPASNPIARTTRLPCPTNAAGGYSSVISLFCGATLYFRAQLRPPYAIDGSVPVCRHWPSSVRYGAVFGSYRTVTTGGNFTSFK